jgi:nucleotide-binding universal stress UspA family protein
VIQTILVAIDGSESADNTLNFALDLADKYSADLIILNVFTRITASSMITYPTISVGSFPAVMEEFSSELKLRHEMLLGEALKKAKMQKPHLNITRKLIDGRPPDKIVEAAKECNVDLIILGHRGLSGIKEFVLGSVSDRVAHGAECAVLILK